MYVTVFPFCFTSGMLMYCWLTKFTFFFVFGMQNGLNALLWAADRGHLDCVLSLLKTNIDINAADKVTLFPSIVVGLYLLRLKASAFATCT